MIKVPHFGCNLLKQLKIMFKPFPFLMFLLVWNVSALVVINTAEADASASEPAEADAIASGVDGPEGGPSAEATATAGGATPLPEETIAAFLRAGAGSGSGTNNPRLVDFIRQWNPQNGSAPASAPDALKLEVFKNSDQKVKDAMNDLFQKAGNDPANHPPGAKVYDYVLKKLPADEFNNASRQASSSGASTGGSGAAGGSGGTAGTGSADDQSAAAARAADDDAAKKKEEEEKKKTAEDEKRNAIDDLARNAALQNLLNRNNQNGLGGGPGGGGLGGGGSPTHGGGTKANKSPEYSPQDLASLFGKNRNDRDSDRDSEGESGNNKLQDLLSSFFKDSGNNQDSSSSNSNKNKGSNNSGDNENPFELGDSSETKENPFKDLNTSSKSDNDKKGAIEDFDIPELDSLDTPKTDEVPKLDGLGSAKAPKQTEGMQTISNNGDFFNPGTSGTGGTPQASSPGISGGGGGGSSVQAGALGDFDFSKIGQDSPGGSSGGGGSFTFAKPIGLGSAGGGTGADTSSGNGGGGSDGYEGNADSRDLAEKSSLIYDYSKFIKDSRGRGKAGSSSTRPGVFGMLDLQNEICEANPNIGVCRKMKGEESVI